MTDEDLARRLLALEDAEKSRVEQRRKSELEIQALEMDLSQAKEDIKSLKSGIARGLWIIGGGFMSSVVAWIAAGGMSNVGK